MSDLQKQILIGSLLGILVCVATYIALGGKRDELTALTNAIVTLEAEVEKGKQLKANYLILKKEVDEQNKQLDELIALMPSELERGDLPIKLKKLADSSGLYQTHFTAKAGKSNKEQFHTAYPIEFTFQGGFHDFGQFASYISGFDKMVNIGAIKLKSSKIQINPVEIQCTINAFVYDPDSVPTRQKQSKAPTASTAASQKNTEGD